tara:strand:- start:2021 stop:2311 length:291 start_codon:yes stop_codon:yes gene_type:complete
MYIIKYECDLLGDHTALILDLCEIETITFNNAFDAILFIEECTHSLTKVEEIIPWMATNKDIFTNNRSIAEPFSMCKDEIANVYLVKDQNDFKTLI